jgi:hypothetical protein
MKIIIDIPDDLAQRITAAGDDLPRFVLELFGINEYKKGHLTTEELRRLLGFRTRMRWISETARCIHRIHNGRLRTGKGRAAPIRVLNSSPDRRKNLK